MTLGIAKSSSATCGLESCVHNNSAFHLGETCEQHDSWKVSEPIELLIMNKATMAVNNEMRGTAICLEAVA